MSYLFKFPRLFILLLICSAPMIGAVLFVPAVPDLTNYFHIDPSLDHWTMTLYLFGFSLGALIYGPLGNCLGRKKTLQLGLIIAIFGSILAFFSESFWIFCSARFIQALGASSGFKIIFTMADDLLSDKKAVKANSLLLLGPAIVPSVGVAIGGFLTTLFGWSGCFAFLAIYFLLLFVLTTTLPETAKKLEAQGVLRIVQGYLHQFKNSFLILHGLLMGLSIAMIYVFATEASFIAIDSMGITPKQFGLFTLLLPIGMFIGMLIGNALTLKTSALRIMLASILISSSGAIAMGICFYNQWFSGWCIFLPQLIIQLGGFLLWITASSKGLSEASDKSNASAVMQFINVGFAAVASSIVGTFILRAPIKIPISMGALSLMALVLWLFLKMHQQRSPH